MDDAGRDLNEEDVQPDLNQFEAISKLEAGLELRGSRALGYPWRKGFATFKVTSNSGGQPLDSSSGP